MPEYQLIPRERITWREQERKHFGKQELTELAETIRQHGVLEPIGVVRDGDNYVGLFGQRRWLASELAGLKNIPAIVHGAPSTEAEAIEVRLIENLARQQLKPLEQANGLAQLIKATGLSATEAGRRVGLNPAAVSKSLALLELPAAIQKQIDCGAIAAGAGYELSQIDDPLVQAELAAQVAGGALSRDALSAAVKKLKKPAADASPSKSRVTAILDARRCITFTGSGLASVDALIEWLEELLSKARKARPQNLALNTFVKILRDQSKG